MWIRSQNREKLCIAKRVWYAKENHTINVAPFGIIGTYATKERALEVLDEIEIYTIGNIYIPFEINEYNYNDTSNIFNVSIVDKMEKLPIVYQMPKE